jgi:hypothetical protein
MVTIGPEACAATLYLFAIIKAPLTNQEYRRSRLMGLLCGGAYNIEWVVKLIRRRRQEKNDDAKIRV